MCWLCDNERHAGLKATQEFFRRELVRVHGVPATMFCSPRLWGSIRGGLIEVCGGKATIAEVSPEALGEGGDGLLEAIVGMGLELEVLGFEVEYPECLRGESGHV